MPLKEQRERAEVRERKDPKTIVSCDSPFSVYGGEEEVAQSAGIIRVLQRSGGWWRARRNTGTISTGEVKAMIMERMNGDKIEPRIAAYNEWLTA